MYKLKKYFDLLKKDGPKNGNPKKSHLKKKTPKTGPN